MKHNLEATNKTEKATKQQNIRLIFGIEHNHKFFFLLFLHGVYSTRCGKTVLNKDIFATITILNVYFHLQCRHFRLFIG